MMSQTQSSPIEGKSAPARLRMDRLVIGMLAVGLSVISIAATVLSTPWQIRFPIVAVTALFGPAIPALRLRPELSLQECLVYGIGVNVALQMLVGLALVMWHIWIPVTASLGLFVISLVVGLKLLFTAGI
jgi:uncharacterized membrane protein